MSGWDSRLVTLWELNVTQENWNIISHYCILSKAVTQLYFVLTFIIQI